MAAVAEQLDGASGLAVWNLEASGYAQSAEWRLEMIDLLVTTASVRVRKKTHVQFWQAMRLLPPESDTGIATVPL